MTYARVRHDREVIRDCKSGDLVANARQNDACWNFEDDRIYPAPVPHFTAPRGSTNTRRMSKDWFDFVGSINTVIAWLKARVNWSGYFNSASNREYAPGETIPLDPPTLPKPEGITSIGNNILVLERRDGWTRFETFKYRDDPPDPEKVNQKTHPWLFCKFTSIAPDGTVGLAPNGLEFYFPYLAADEAWIEDKWLEFDVELPTEDDDMPTIELPLWRDYSKHQGQIDFEVVAKNNIVAMITRAGISWGHQDQWFPANWAGAKEIGIYRTSYHVIWTDQPIVKQADNWYKGHDARDVLPRVIDLEVDRLDSNIAKAEAVFEMSELVLKRDGVRPIIYSRHMLITEWLASWSKAFLNEHYFYLAQYLNDPTVEHPGPPTLPEGLSKSRVLLHQSADKLPGFDGEAQSAAVDINRWQLGDETQMHAFIADNWGGEPPDDPPPDEPPEDELADLRARVHDAVDIEFDLGK